MEKVFFGRGKVGMGDGMLVVNDTLVFRFIENEIANGEFDVFQGTVEVRVTIKNSEVPFGEVEAIEIDRV